MPVSKAQPVSTYCGAEVVEFTVCLQNIKKTSTVGMSV